MFSRRYEVMSRFYPYGSDAPVNLDSELYWLRSSAIRAANRKHFFSDYMYSSRAHVVVDRKTGQVVHTVRDI